MKISRIIMIFAAVALIGLLIAAAAFAAGGSFDPVTSPATHNATSIYSSVSVSAASADIKLLPSESGDTYAVCDETDKIKYTLKVEDGVLKIEENDSRRWYDMIGIFIGSRKVTLYLPIGAYSDLTLASESGSIECREDGFSFKSAALSSLSGSIYFSADVSESVDASSSSGSIGISSATADSMLLRSSSGSIHITDSTAKGGISAASSSGSIGISSVTADSVLLESASGSIHITDSTAKGGISATSSSGSIGISSVTADSLLLESSSGSIRLTDSTAKGGISATSSSGSIGISSVTADSVLLKSSSGSIRLTDTIASDEFKIDSSSGSVKLERCDAATLLIETNSGSVSATLLTGKLFDVSSTSGNISCPSSVEASGKCTVTTISGSINIKIAE